MQRVPVLLRIHWLLVCLLAATIPGPFRLSPPVVIMLCAVWGLRMPVRETLRGLRRSPLLIGWIIFYLLHLASYLWSEQKGESAFDLETKLSFFALPLLVGASAEVPRVWLSRVLHAFVAGVVIVAVGCFLQAGMLYRATGEADVFFYHALVKGLDANAVYSTWYAVTALAVLLFYPMPWLSRGIPGRLVHAAAVLLLAVFIFLLSSRTLILFCLLVLVPTAVIRYARQQTPGRGLRMTIAIVLGLAGVIAAVQPGRLRNRFEDISGKGVAAAFLPDYHGQQPQFSNLSLRLFLWRIGLRNMQQHDLWLAGCGNGDAHQLQNAEMARLGFEGIDTNPPTSSFYNVNLHNMPFQTALMLGIPAMVFFLGLLLWPVRLARRNPAAVFFTVFFCLSYFFMMQEAALQTQAGIVFYLFFSALLCASNGRVGEKKGAVNPL